MADIEVSWPGLRLGGFGPLLVGSVEGWDDRPEVTFTDRERTQGHGDHVGQAFARARVVTVSGRIGDGPSRDQLVQRIQAATPVRQDLQPLTIKTFGRELTAWARVAKRSIPVAFGYADGRLPFVLQWRCPSPLRYGATKVPTTALPLSGGGITYPITYPITYGAAGVSGRVTVTNAGTAPAPLIVAVRGGLPQGWLVSAGDRVLAYPVEVPSGQTVVVNSADGTVLVEGTASRRGNLTRADWLTCPPADPITGTPGTLDVQFASLGGERDPDALMTVTCVDTYW